MMFAAGFGTRMGPLTAERPKPLIEVSGKPLIDHALALVSAFGARTTVVNLHYKPELLQDHLHDKPVTISLEHPDILETGGGLRNALPLLGKGPVFTLNTDAVWKGPNPLQLLAEAWDPKKMDALLLCIPTDHADGHDGKGDFVVDDLGRAKRGLGMIYSGVQILKTHGLRSIEERRFSLNLLWDAMIEEERLFAIAYPGRWCDVGQPESIMIAEKMLGDTHV